MPELKAIDGGYREHQSLIKDDDDLIKQMQADYKAAEEASREWRDEARELYDLISGDQWDELSKAKMVDELRPITTFNISIKYMNAVSGLEIGNRQEVRYIPREIGDSPVNELLTNAAIWVRDECDADDEESEAFFDMTLTGMGWTETFVSSDTNPEGDILIERRDNGEMFWDHKARRRNLADARWVMRVKPTTLEEIAEIWPDKVEEIGARTHGPDVQDQVDSGIHDATNAWRYLPDANLAGRVPSKELPLADYQWWTMETVYHLRTMQRGDETITASQWRRVKPFLEQNRIPHEVEPYQRRKYYRAFIVNRVVLEKGDCPSKNGFTYRCMTGQRDRNSNTWFGLGRVIRDPQLWLNKFFSQILHTINSNAKGGVMAVREAFENPQKAEQDWAKPDSIVWMDKMSDQNGNPTVIPKPQAPYPQGLDRLMMFTVDALPNVTGLNLELLGLAGKVQPGVLEAQRKQAGMTMIAWAFDSKRRYTKEQGRLLAEYIREYISDGRLIRVDQELGPTYIPLLRDPATVEYDVIVDEAPSSPNMKERVWAMLVELIPALLQNGYPVPPDVLDYSPLPASLAQKWKEMAIKSQDNSMQQQIAQQMAQLDAAERQADIQKTQVETVDEQASAQERAASMLLKQAQAEKIRSEIGKTAAETRKTAAETGKIMGGG